VICLETSFVTDYLREHPDPDDSTDAGPAGVYLAANETETFAVSVLTLHEVFYGDAEMRADAESAMDRSAEALRFADVLPFETRVARESALLRADLTASGDPIPLPDAFIAATARYHDYPLVCADEHFERVSDLDTIRYK